MKKVFLTLGLCFALLCVGIYCILPHDFSSQSVLASAEEDPWASKEIAPGHTGNGTENDPWVIRQASDLTRAITSGGLPANNVTINSTHYRQHFILANDITLTGTWTPRILAPFCVFDGNNYTISGLTITTGGTQGFFANMSGTIKNVTFVGVSVKASSTYAAAVAARVWNSPPSGITEQERIATFSRVFVGTAAAPGSVSGTYNVGGLVGEIANGCTVRIDSCLNRAQISASGVGHAGGLVGRSGQQSTGCELYVTRSGNEGAISCSSSSSATADGVGGVIGCVDGGPTTVEYCYNRGTVTRGHSGIIGVVRVNSGRATITNCYNDAVITHPTSSVYRAAITVRESANTIIWAQNNWNNHVKFTGNLFTAGSAELSNTNITQNGRFTDAAAVNVPSGNLTYNISPSYSGQNGLDSFIEILNIGTETPAFIRMGDTIQLISVTKTRIITFKTNGAPRDDFKIHWNPDAPTFSNFPETIGGIGERPYHSFDGWKLNGVGTAYELGDVFPFENAANVIFEAMWTKISINIDFYDNDTLGAKLLFYGSPLTTFTIDQPNLTLDADGWNDAQGRSVWMIKKAGSEFPAADESSWVPLSNVKNFDFSSRIEDDANGIAFLRAYEESGTVTLKLVVASAGTTTIEVTSENAEGGTFAYSLAESASVTQVNTSFQYFSLPSTESKIEKLYVTAFEHYYIESIQIRYGETGEYITYQSPDAEQFVFTVPEEITDKSSIKVILKKTTYELEVCAVLVTVNPDFDHYSLPQSMIDNGFEKNIHVNTEPTISIRTLETSSDGQYAFKFLGFKIFDGDNFVPIESAITEIGGVNYAVLTISGKIDNSWLQNYLTDMQNVLIIAEYVPLYSVLVSDGNDSYWGVDGSFDVSYYLTDSLTGEAKSLSLDTYHLVAEGSTIYMEVYTSLFVEDDDSSFFYELLSIRGLSSSEYYVTQGNHTTASINIFGNRNLNPAFGVRPFEIVFQAVSLANDNTSLNTIHGVDGFAFTKMGNGDEERIYLGDTLISLFAPEIPGYEIADKFTLINQSTGLVYEITSEISISERFLFDYISRSTDKITIYAHYTKLFRLSLSVSLEGAGFVKVYTNVVNAENLVYSGSGQNGDLEALKSIYRTDRLILVAEAEFGFEFAEFSGFDTNKSEEPDGNTLEISIGTGRTIIAHFRPGIIEVNESLSEKGFGNSTSSRTWSGSDQENSYRINDDKESLRVGDKIEIVATPSFFGSEVKKWTINGINIDELDNVERIGNVIIITLTADWYITELDRLDSKVHFGFTTEFILFVLLPGILVPLLGLVFLFYYLNLQRKKRIIKKALLEDKQARAGFTHHGMLVDIREGKDVSGVSDEAVKAAMKAEKEKKKDK